MGCKKSEVLYAEAENPHGVAGDDNQFHLKFN